MSKQISGDGAATGTAGSPGPECRTSRPSPHSFELTVRLLLVGRGEELRSQTPDDDLIRRAEVLGRRAELLHLYDELFPEGGGA